MPNTLSPNMSLILPTVGQEPGPNWALDLNNSLSIIDQHNHAPGNGAPITSASLDINIDLSYNSNNATDLRSARFTPQLTPLSGGQDVGSLYVSGQDLYYNDTLGNQIQLTAFGNVNGTPGSIGSLISPAAVTYVPLTQTYVFESNQTNATPASLDLGNLFLRNITPGGNYIQIQPNAVLPANYSLTLPSALPGAGTTSVLLLDSLGNIATSGTATSLSVSTLNAPNVNVSSALSIKNDNGLLQFKNSADTVQFASIVGSSSGLTLNLPDTADSYTFQVNTVTKAVIDNNGIDAGYLYGTIPSSVLPPTSLNTTAINYNAAMGTASAVLVATNSITCGASRPIVISISPNSNSYTINVSRHYWYVVVTGPSGYSQTVYPIRTYDYATGGTTPTPTDKVISSTVFVTSGVLGTYTASLYAGNGNFPLNGGNVVLQNYNFQFFTF